MQTTVTVGPHPARWYILIVYAINSLFQSVELLVYQSVPEIVYECYAKAKIDASSLNLIISLPAVFTIIFTPFMFFIDAYFNSVRALTLFGVALLNIQNLLRMIPHWFKSTMPNALVVMILSQIFNNLAMLFSYALPSRVSSTWFPPQERILSTGICSLMNPIGTALTFLLVPLIVSDADKYVVILYILLIAQGVLSVIILIYFPAKPSYPPSHSELAKEEAFEKEAANILRRIKEGKDPFTEDSTADDVESTEHGESSTVSSVPSEHTEEDSSHTEAQEATNPSTAPPEQNEGNMEHAQNDESTSAHSSQEQPSQDANSNELQSKSFVSRLPKSIRFKMALRPVKTMFQLFLNKQMMLIMLACAFHYGTLQSWAFNVPILYLGANIRGKFGSYVAFMHLFFCAVGTFCESAIEQRFRKREKLFLCFNCTMNILLSAFFIVSFGFGKATGTTYEEGKDENAVSDTFDVVCKTNKWVMAVLTTLQGYFEGTPLSTYFTLSAEVTYPVSDAITGGMVILFVSLGMMVIPLMYGYIGIGWVNVIASCLLLVALILYISLRPVYKRSEQEEKGRLELQSGGEALQMGEVQDDRIASS